MSEEIDYSQLLEQLEKTDVKGSYYQSEMQELIKRLIEDRLAEEHLKETPYWPMVSNSLKLSFLDKNDQEYVINLLESEFVRKFIETPPSLIDTDFIELTNQARMIGLFNVKRAMGTEQSKINERIAIITQFKFTTTDIRETQEKQPLWRRIFRLR